MKAIVLQSVDKGLIKSKTILMDMTHILAACQRKRSLEVLRDAAKRLFRSVVKKHPKLEKKLPARPNLEKDQPDGEKIMIAICGFG